MALKAGLKGLRSEAQGCARTTAHAADHARPTGGWPRSASAFLRRWTAASELARTRGIRLFN